MSKPFDGSFQVLDDAASPAALRPSPVEYAAWVQEQLTRLQPGELGILRFRQPRPTAAFSAQDTTHPDYPRIRDHARLNGFEPIERGTGGRLTVFDEGSLAITVIAFHPDPHAHAMTRFKLFSGAISEGLQKLGIDARIGEIPNEYCPGKFSINAGGRVKLVGVAQRIKRQVVQMGAIIAVRRSDKACAAIADAYRDMGLTFDRNTYGAITEIQPGLLYELVRAQLVETVSAAIAG